MKDKPYYSSAVDTFTVGHTLLEMIQANFEKTIKQFAFNKNQYDTGNEKIDDIAPFTFFMEVFSENKYTDEERKAMQNPYTNCEMVWNDKEDIKQQLLTNFKNSIATI